jgi:hypothetical protein
MRLTGGVMLWCAEILRILSRCGKCWIPVRQPALAASELRSCRFPSAQQKVFLTSVSTMELAAAEQQILGRVGAYAAPLLGQFWWRGSAAAPRDSEVCMRLQLPLDKNKPLLLRHCKNYFLSTIMTAE